MRVLRVHSAATGLDPHATSQVTTMLRAELTVAPARDAQKLAGSGLIVINPPWTLADELGVLLPALAQVFAPREGGTRIDWLAGEK